jgi:hypothetical protein
MGNDETGYIFRRLQLELNEPICYKMNLAAKRIDGGANPSLSATVASSDQPSFIILKSEQQLRIRRGRMVIKSLVFLPGKEKGQRVPAFIFSW